jgi:hypothetical protein
MRQQWMKLIRRRAGKVRTRVPGFPGSTLLAFLLLACPFSAASGATPVSGPISSNTTWTDSGSPYFLNEAVQITNGARLTIEPGVTVQASAGGSLTVISGALSAHGTAERPIVFTGASGEPSYWGPLKFTDGTIDADSGLSHVLIQYGRGLLIESASPALNDLRLEGNDAPAITIDLVASPVGERLSASGNTLNGILVPAGVVAGQTAWRLKGIPYVVAEGTVEVGRPPFSLIPSTLQLIAGQVGHLTLNLPTAAPAGGLVVALQSSNPNVEVGSQVTVPTDTYTADVVVTAVAQGSATITATSSDPAYGSATASVTVIPRPALALSPNALTFGTGRSATLSVQIEAPNENDVHVGLSSANTSIVTVPTDVTIARGATSASFEVTGVAAGSTTVRAQADGFSQATAQATVRPVSLNAPATAFVAPELSADLTLTLSDPAPAGGLTIAIDNNRSDVLAAPASVSVPADATSVTIPLDGLLDSTSAAKLTFTASGYQQASTLVTVRRIAASLDAGNPPRTIWKGSTVVLPVSLSLAAPSGGVTLDVVATLEGVVGIEPSQVFVPEGETAATSTISVSGVEKGRTSIVLKSTAATPGIDGISVVTVEEPMKLRFGYERMEVGKSLRRPVMLYCGSDEAPCSFDEPVVIALDSSDSAKVSVPSQVTLPAHASNVSFDVAGLDVTVADVSIQAHVQAPVIDPVVMPLAVQVVAPALRFDGLGEEQLPQGVGQERQGFLLCWATADGDSQYGSADTLVSLEIDATPSGIVDGIYATSTSPSPLAQVTLPAGQACVRLYAGSPSAAGSYRVRATVPAMGQWTSTAQQVMQSKLQFEDASLTLGQGLRVDFLHVVMIPRCSYSIPISFVSSDPNVEIVSDLPDSYCDTWVSIRGAGLTTEPATLTASVPGADPAVLAVSVVPKRVAFNGLDRRRSLTSDRDSFEMVWEGDHFPYSELGEDITLSLADEAPADVLPELAIVDWGGEGVSTLQLTQSHSVYVASPTRHGSYRISAALGGNQVGLSDLQIVGDGMAEWLVDYEEMDADGALAVGEGLKHSVKLRLLDDGSSGGQVMTPTEAVTVALVSRAPAWVQVPASVTFPAGVYAELDVPVIGLAATAEPVLVEAYVAGEAEPSSSMDVRVYDSTTLVFDMDRARAVHGAVDQLAVHWEVQYPCSLSPEETCALEQSPAQAQTFELAIVDAGTPPIVAGFRDDENAVVSTVDYRPDSEGSDVVYVEAPIAAGSYRVQAGLVGTSRTWTSDAVTVDGPRLRIAEGWPDGVAVIGSGLRLSGRIEAVVGDVPVALADELTVQIACVDPLVCVADSQVVIAAGQADAAFGVVGKGLGQTSVRATAAGMQDSPSYAVKVVEPEIQAAVPISIGRGEEKSFSIQLVVPGASGLQQEAAADIALELSSALPTVASVQPATATVPTGGSTSGPIVLHGTRTGTTAVSARGTHVQPYTSGLITVVGNGGGTP